MRLHIRRLKATRLPSMTDVKALYTIHVTDEHIRMKKSNACGQRE